MAVSDGIIQDQPIIARSNFAASGAASAWDLDTSVPLEDIISTSTDYQNRESQLNPGYYDGMQMSYAHHPGENNAAVNSEQFCSPSPVGSLPVLTPFSKRPRPGGAPVGPDELVITSRPPTVAEEPDAHFRGYYLKPDGENARHSYFVAGNGFPNGPPAEWNPTNGPTGSNPDPYILFGKSPANVISGHISTRLRYAASFQRIRIVGSAPSGFADLDNTPPQEEGQTYGGHPAGSHSINPTDMGASHRNLRGHFPALGWSLEHQEAGVDMNGDPASVTEMANPPDIARSPSRFELDNMEGFGYLNNRAWQTAHFFDDTNDDGRITNAKISKSPSHFVTDLADFHEYIVDITPEKIGFAVDGVYTLVIDTPRPMCQAKPRFIPDPDADYRPGTDEDGNATVEHGEIRRHADGSPYFVQNFTISNLADPAAFIRGIGFRQLVDTSASKRAETPPYNSTDELVIREWGMYPLIVDNPDKWGATVKGVPVQTPSTPSASPRPPQPTLTCRRETGDAVTVFATPVSDDTVAVDVLKNGTVVHRITSAPWQWTDTAFNSTSNYAARSVTAGEVSSVTTPAVTKTHVNGATPVEPTVETPMASLGADEDRCAPLRLGTTNHVTTSTLTAVPDPVTPLDSIKNEYPSRFARWTTLDENGEITIDSVFAGESPIEYMALPGWVLPGTTEIKLELFDSAGDPVAGYVAEYQTLASLLPLGVFRAGIDEYGGVNARTKPSVYMAWLDDSYVASSSRLTLRPNADGAIDIRGRMLLMGEKLEFETNFDYGGGLSYMTPPRLIELASGSVIPSRAQKRSRRMSLVFDHMTGFDRSRLSDMETELAGKPFIVSAHPKRAGWQYRDYNFLARLEPALVYENTFEDRHQVRNFILREV